MPVKSSKKDATPKKPATKKAAAPAKPVKKAPAPKKVVEKKPKKTMAEKREATRKNFKGEIEALAQAPEGPAIDLVEVSAEPVPNPEAQPQEMSVGVAIMLNKFCTTIRRTLKSIPDVSSVDHVIIRRGEEVPAEERGDREDAVEVFVGGVITNALNPDVVDPDSEVFSVNLIPYSEVFSVNLMTFDDRSAVSVYHTIEERVKQKIADLTTSPDARAASMLRSCPSLTEAAGIEVDGLVLVDGTLPGPVGRVQPRRARLLDRVEGMAEEGTMTLLEEVIEPHMDDPDFFKTDREILEETLRALSQELETFATGFKAKLDAALAKVSDPNTIASFFTR